MKKNKNIIIYTILVGFGLSILSCTKDFNEVNTDPLGKTEVNADQLLAPTLVNLMTTNMLRNRNFNNELMQVTVDLGDTEGKTFRYDIRRNAADNTWNNWYLNLTNITDIQAIASKPEKLNKSYQGISLILQSWVYSLLTDTYGDVPYSEANKGKDGNYQPVFDKQKDIYLGMFEKLEEANNLLKDGTSIVATSDPIFKGDVAKWRRLGNSLYLRLLLRVSGKAEVSSTVIAKIKDIVDTNPNNYPIMETNQHTAKLQWTGSNISSALYTSPFMANVRVNDFYVPAIGEFFINNLVVWNDPRILQAFGTNNINRFRIRPGTNGYAGVPSGYVPGNEPAKQSVFYSASDNAVLSLQTDPYTGIIMNAAEVDFIIAEAAAKGWVSKSAQSFYYKGIADAINYWIPNIMNGGATDPAAIAYADAADIEWNNSLPLQSASATSVSKMSLIHQQKYYALFLVDFQQWFEYRRSTYPMLPMGLGLLNNRVMPARLFYPVVTQSANPTNYKNAVASQGPDVISTQVWWQKP
ncbi:SusD/RagB family nutrient-binding outer membrane lipoprotein [Pedobacter boryungensis]|uniref:SusD/RagB family nutrient-binding outer membrane lipoprotein n=1 Tax=Pedobacter boryungensis TaxID=869962 RepID=A0ABX2DA04_9SPHI|nr:SusD/RagB family nutrient-binding outer membrane lipoprotein [Pedobacter boryungensis]NQX30883.1 SusD/RagB family nutrient-binding outer membrane lipoprotein [Pedobacter boryungensis]